MKLGEVCLLTTDVARLAGFYRTLLGVEAGEDGGDPQHQFVLAGEPGLAVMRAGKPLEGQSAVLAFTVEDIYAAHARLLEMGATVLEPPTARPWGAVNLRFQDPDGNEVYLRSFPPKGA